MLFISFIVADIASLRAFFMILLLDNDPPQVHSNVTYDSKSLACVQDENSALSRA